MVQGWVQIAIFVAIVIALTPVLGGYMARVYGEGKRVFCSSAPSGHSSASSTACSALTRARSKTGSATPAP